MNNIILIGFMTSGKSTVGKSLAAKLNYEFIDTDALIEATAKKTIPEIFKEFGEDHFRQLEKEALQSIAQKKNCIVATGGGIIVKPENRAALKQAGTVFYLKINPSDVLERAGDYTTRPLINYPDPTKRQTVVAELMAKREPWYQEAANYIVSSKTGQPAETVNFILKTIRG